jgi:hypothetical protein
MYELIDIFYEDHCLIVSEHIELTKEYIIMAG